MEKKTVNLILKKEKETKTFKKLKFIFVFAAFFSLLLFIGGFFLSLVYLNNHLTGYNFVKKEISTFQDKIASQKNFEGIYHLTVAKISVLEKLEGTKKTFLPLIKEIANLEQRGLNLKTISSDHQGVVSLSLEIENVESLENLINLLLSKEKEKKISKIEASGIVREKKGVYLLTVNFESSPTLLK